MSVESNKEISGLIGRIFFFQFIFLGIHFYRVVQKNYCANRLKIKTKQNCSSSRFEIYCSRDYTGNKIAGSRVCKNSRPSKCQTAFSNSCNDLHSASSGWEFPHSSAPSPALSAVQSLNLCHFCGCDIFIPSSLNEVEHFHVCLWGICASSSVLLLFVSFAHFFSFSLLTMQFFITSRY